VVVHSTSVGGSLSIQGGGGGTFGGITTGACDNTATEPTPQPWAADSTLDFVPVYSDIEDVAVGGNLSVVGLQSCWLGALCDQVGGNVNISNNTMGDPDAMEIAENLVSQSTICFNDLPAVQFGDSGAAPSVVSGQGAGECGFNVQQLNPAAAAGEGPGVLEPIAVSSWSMGTYQGAHVETSGSGNIPFGTTSSGDQIVGEQNTSTLAGNGLVGTIGATCAPGGGPGTSPCENVLGTILPNGTEPFYVVDNCECSFGGQTGLVTILGQGTAWANGQTSGTFMIISSGPAADGLTTIAGYGTFSSSGQPAGTLRLVEHLKALPQTAPI